MSKPTPAQAKNVRRLADFIEGERYEFNMRDGSASARCGTADCIGAHAATLWRSPRVPVEKYIADLGGVIFTWDNEKLAAKTGFDLDQLWQLFSPKDRNGRRVRLETVTRSMAVRALRRNARTGEFYFD